MFGVVLDKKKDPFVIHNGDCNEKRGKNKNNVQVCELLLTISNQDNYVVDKGKKVSKKTRRVYIST